jgi:Domain of unknown function (DUF4838)
MLLLSLIALNTSTAPAMGIVIGDDAPEPVRFAAEELARYIEKASGVSLKVTETPALTGQLAVCLTTIPGDVNESVPMPSSKDEEAYRIASPDSGGRLFSGRSPRAVVYAVYDFLEEELGYRWYFPSPEDEIAPTLSAEALTDILSKSVDREEVPAFPFREREFRDVMPMCDQTDGRIIQQIDWWAKLRMNRFLLNFNYARNADLWKRWKEVLIPEIKRRGMLVGIGEHGSYPLFLSPGRYADEHPDWFCEIDGERIPAMHMPGIGGTQFCTTNSDAVATYLENFAAFIEANPEIDFYYPAPNDVGKWCECKTCRELSVADRYMLLDNQVAEMLGKVKPGTRVMHLAYANHRLPPEKTVPHPMIDVDVACWGRDLAYPLSDPRTMPGNDEYLDVFRQWAAVCRKVEGPVRPQLVYHCKLMRHYWLGIHLLPLSILDDDFACAQELGFDGFDFPLGFLGIWTKSVNAYAVARKCWDPEESADATASRFLSDCYGDQAADARRIHELVEEAFADKHYGSSLTLSWHPERIGVRGEPLEGLGDNAREAVAKLEEALAIAGAFTDGDGTVAGRFKKLGVVLRRARDEQQMLVVMNTLMGAYEAFQNAKSDGEREERRKVAFVALQETKAANDLLAERYSLEEDLAGLYWAGATHDEIAKSLERWNEALLGYIWQEAGAWETGDFEKMNESIVKTFDVTELVKDLPACAIQVRFRYERGELGVTTSAVELWQHTADGTETRLSEDRHGGFAGYEHKNATYTLRLKHAPSPEARYLIKTEFGPYATRGTVAERGSYGKILLGVPE